MDSPRNLIIILGTAIVSGLCVSIPARSSEYECYAEEKVCVGNCSQCYKLLTKGPCEEGEWLVLQKPILGEKNKQITPICTKVMCEEGKYYWPKTKSCVKSKEKNELCDPEEELVINVFGEGECSCGKEPPSARLNGNRKNPCFQLYTRGPCDVGYVLVVPPGEITRAVCVEDPCHEESEMKKKQGTLSMDGILAPSESGRCYQLGTQGPCPEDFVFKVHAGTLDLGCNSLTTGVFTVPIQTNCKTDPNGDCQKPISVQKHSLAERFNLELTDALQNYGK